MNRAAVIIPNFNGMKYLDGCLSSLRAQTSRNFRTVLVDNGSTDGSADFVRENYPEVEVIPLSENTGFCHAVNTGIRHTAEPFVILLNNDTVCEPDFVRELILCMEKYPDTFSAGAKMVRMDQPELIDDAGDYYCALGWAFADGKGKPAENYDRPKKVFSACAGAAIYRRSMLKKTGLFDERHFAYLEDVDLGWRAQRYGYVNRYEPKAVVHHAGSAASGSRYNAFKTRYAARNSVYIIYKNMPLGQIILNLPLLAAGVFVKLLFFTAKGFPKEYMEGLSAGFALCRPEKKLPWQIRDLFTVSSIQLQLWANLIRRAGA